jgi:hypothetical protein
MNPSVRTVISNTSNNSDRSAKSLKSDQRRAELQANDLKAKIDELERANRALDSQISHYQHVFSNAESFEKKNKAMQEVKALREQQLIRERSCMFWLAKTKKKRLAKRVARLSLPFSPALITPPPLPCRPWSHIPFLALAGKLRKCKGYSVTRMQISRHRSFCFGRTQSPSLTIWCNGRRPEARVLRTLAV